MTRPRDAPIRTITVHLPTRELDKPAMIREIPDLLWEIREQEDAKRRVVAAANRALICGSAGVEAALSALKRPGSGQ